MGKQRKKTLQELMQERATGTGNQSAYTTEPRKTYNTSVKTQVDNLYKRNEPQTFSEKVSRKYNQIMNDFSKIGSNFMTSTGSNLKSSLYYIETASNQNFDGYKFLNQQQAVLKEQEQQRKNVGTGESKEVKLPQSMNIRDRELYQKEDAPMLRKATESPIQKSIGESIQKDEEKIQQNIESTQTKVGRKLAELTPSINQSLIGMGMSAINPALGIGYFQTSAGGNYTREAKAKGMNDQQAFTYGTVMGALESVTESVGNKLTTNVGKAFFKDGAKEGLKAFGLDIAENFLEEAVMEPLSEYVTQITGGQADWENIGQRMWESGINGAISSVLMGGASAGIGKAVQLVNKMQNGEQVTQKEIADTLKEINKSEEVEIEKLLFDSFKFTADDLMRNIDAQNRTNQKLDTFATDISRNEFAGIKPASTMQNKPVLEQEQQTTLPKYDLPQNQFSQVFEESAKKHQIDTNNDGVRIAKHLTDKANLQLEFEKLGKKTLAVYKNGRVIVNADAIKNNPEKVLQNIVLHEAIHGKSGSKELNDVMKTVLSFVKAKGEYKGARLDLDNIYAEAYKGRPDFEQLMDEEVVTNTLGEYFGTEEGLNELINYVDDRTTLQKIYDFVKDILNRVTGYKDQEQFFRRAERQLAKALQSDYVAKSGDRFSIQREASNESNVNNKSLLALHNLSADKLKGVLELGGFPVPSIAVTNPNNFDHNNYGEISVVFNKNTVNPADSRNEVYSRDGYTPRFPKIGYKINNKIRQTLKDSLRQYVTGSIYDNSYLSNVSSLLDEVNLSEKLNSNNGLDGTIDNLSKNESVKYWYLKENNIPFEEKYREQNYSSVVKNDMLQKFLDNYKGDKNTLNELNFEQIQELKTELEQLWIEENFDNKEMKKWLSEHPNYSPDLDYSKLSNIIMGAYKLNKYGSKKTLDTAKTNEAINSIVSEKEVKSWLKNKFDGIVEKKGIKNSKGFYTNTGTPRSFEQLYDDYTLDNVVKIMTALDTTGTESFFGVGTNEILGTSAKKFDSIEQIKEYENELLKNLTPEQYAEYLEPINEKLKDIETSILEINPTHSNTFMAIDNLGVAIQEVARKLNGKTKLTTSRVISIMNKQGYEVTLEQAQELLDFFKEARELPTQYFEAKPQRAVGFEEVASMVIPNNLDADLKQQLQDRGIKLVEYDPNIEGDRNRKMLSEEMQEYKFSVSTDTKKNIEAKIDRYTRLVEEMQQEGRDSDDWTPYANEILRLQDQLEESRYSYQTNGKWQEFVEKYFTSEGTKTKLGDIKLPEKNVLQENTSNLKQTTTKKETDTEIAKVLNTPVVRQKPQDRKWAIIKANIFDKGIVFEDLSKRAKNRELEAKWDYTLSSSARAQYAIGNARLDENGNKISKGLTEIIDEVGDKIDDFQNYMYHLLNIDRMSLKERFGIDNKPVFGKNIGKDYSERKVEEFEKANPKFKEWAQDVYDYANADKAELVKNGVISQELSDKFAEMYPHYVPIQRADKLGNAINLPLDTRRTGVNTPIKQAKGGSSDLNPLFETLAGRTMQTYRASARNSLGVELKNTLESLNSLNSNVNDAESLDSIMDTISDEKSTSDLLQASKDGKLPTFTVFENGNKVTFDISEDIYDALKPTSAGLSKTSKILNTIGNARRAVLTEYNPLFSITNTVKDTQDVLLNSQHATKTYLKYPEAYWQIIRNGYWKQEYIQNGGAQNTYFKDGVFTKQKQKGWLKRAITFPLDAISTVNGALEMAPRLAEYIASREMGRSVETSMLDASRVTTNFKAGGDVTKFANRNGATFLNAGVQGTMQAIRNVREANAQGFKGWAMLACKMAVAGAPVFILNHLMWGDDDDYEQLQDYVKDGYYIIGKRNDGTFIRIPKGRTLAVIQKVVSNVDKYINNEGRLNIDEVSKDFWDTLKFAIENVAPNNPIDNNVLSPIFQAITNTSWYGEDIVPERLQNVPNAEQFDETTDKFSKWLGEKTGVSPMKINYLLDQYGGGVSDILLPLGTPQAENTPLEDKFVTDPVMKSKYPGEFFEKSDEITKSSNSMYATDTDIVKGKYMSYIQGNMSDLYKEKREIQNSIATDEEKKRQLKEVQKQINETARMALEEVENPKMTGTTALIGNEEFYKNSDGEWERLKDKDKIPDVTMKSYSDYKIKKEQATDKKRKEKNNDKATLNDAEMITLIKESNYTDKEKDALFDAQINDKTYKHLKLLNNNDITKINQYMDYKTADLESNRVYDGTKKGKAVSGSAKNKLTTYLNNSSFNGVERLYLYGQNYKLNSTQRAQLQNYVKKLDLTPQEEKELWLDLSSTNIVEMADGSIRWK